MLVELGPLALFGELNASRYSDKQLAERACAASRLLSAVGRSP